MSDFKAKCIKFDFCWGSAPDPAGGAYRAPPDSLAGFKGPTSIGREAKGQKGEGINEREREGKKRGRRGTDVRLPIPNSWIRRTMSLCCAHDHTPYTLM